jgi:hypothetical protein
MSDKPTATRGKTTAGAMRAGVYLEAAYSFLLGELVEALIVLRSGPLPGDPDFDKRREDIRRDRLGKALARVTGEEV